MYGPAGLASWPRRQQGFAICIIKSRDRLMFRTQEDLELVLLQFMIEFNEARSAKPGVVVYKGYSDTKTGIVLETFRFSGTRSTPANVSSFFRLDWADLRCLATRLNVPVPS
jgi:hypothetical protein